MANDGDNCQDDCDDNNGGQTVKKKIFLTLFSPHLVPSKAGSLRV